VEDLWATRGADPLPLADRRRLRARRPHPSGDRAAAGIPGGAGQGPLPPLRAADPCQRPALPTLPRPGQGAQGRGSPGPAEGSTGGSQLIGVISVSAARRPGRAPASGAWTGGRGTGSSGLRAGHRLS
jgi:hypothetical protein